MKGIIRKEGRKRMGGKEDECLKGVLKGVWDICAFFFVEWYIGRRDRKVHREHGDRVGTSVGSHWPTLAHRDPCGDQHGLNEGWNGNHSGYRRPLTEPHRPHPASTQPFP